MIVDPLTKGVLPKVFYEHTAHMGVMLFEDIQFQWEFVILNALDINIFQLFQFKDFSYFCYFSQK